ncbi:glycosyltransferase family 2 protein [archaeon]|nr:MAG: glycosyltransferase family 2 protein [archaeon]
MNPIVDILYVAFAAFSIYFTMMFFLLFLANRKAIHRTPPLKRLPSVTVIIPVFNEEKNIVGTIRAVKKMVYPKNLLEIIVVNDGSSDGTSEAAGAEGVKVLDKKNGGKASAFNLGLVHAGGEIVACVDADSYPEKGALMNAVPFFEEDGVAAVTTSIFVKGTDTFLQRLQRIEYILIVWARKLLEYLDAVYVTPGPLSLYRKDILKSVGGFDEKNMTEDIEIAWRLMSRGYKVRMSLASKVFTNCPATLKKFWRQRIRWNIGGIQTSLKYMGTFLRKDFKSLGMFVLPFFMTSFVFSLIGLGLFLYIVSSSLLNFVAFAGGAYYVGINPIGKFELAVLPDAFTFFGLLVFLLSIIWIKISLGVMKTSLRSVGLVELLFFLSLYITVFPFILMQSIWIFLTKKKYAW